MHTSPPPLETLKEWLEEHPSYEEDFGHLLLLQKTNDPERIAEGLRPYFESAHHDAREVFHAFIGIDLHPDADDEGTPPVEYPRCLPATTQRGLFGEVMAGLVAESYPLVGGHNWDVPVFLFRHHEDAQNYLFNLARDPDRQRQTIGRLGSDFIGIELDDDGSVSHIIAGEAKWRKTLTPSVVNNLMYGEKIDDPNGRTQNVHSGKGVWHEINTDSHTPVGLRQLAQLLREQDPEGYDAAIFSMEQALLLNTRTEIPRTDLILLVGNARARREKLERLLPYNQIPDEYTAENELQLTEIILDEGDGLIETLYNKLWSTGNSNG